MKISIHKSLLFLSIVLCSMHAHASLFVKCTGAATIQSIEGRSEDQLSAVIKLIEHSFKCQGHSDKVDPGGVIRTVRLKIDKGVNPMLLQVGTIIDVSYNYGDGMTPDGVISWKEWVITGVNTRMNELPDNQESK